MKTVALVSDHGGFEIKHHIVKYLLSKGYAVKDLGCYDTNSVDYPDYGHDLADTVISENCDLAFAFCGSANGISITLNRHKGVRAAICWLPELATLAREHNDANVCSIPGRFVDKETAERITDAFLSAEFEGGRHAIRVQKIEIE